jgi:hypothetical protein
MKTRNYILFSTLTVAGIFIAKLIVAKLTSRENFSGALSKKEIEKLYSQVKL